MKKIAVIGAGLSGLTFARTLADVADVEIFEKSRGFGGRMATRRHERYQFDHGAQFFTAKSDEFQAFLQPWIAAGVIRRWDARFVEIEGDRITGRRTWCEDYPHYVGAPGMNAIGRALAEGLDVRLQTRVDSIESLDGGWRLFDTEAAVLGEYDWLVSAIPPAQAAELLPPDYVRDSGISDRIVPGCYALMLGFDEPLQLGWDAALVKHDVISWISVDSSKPGRPEGYNLLVHASNRWAEDNMARADEAVIAAMIRATSEVTGRDIGAALHVALQRWRYANAGPGSGTPALVDACNQIAAIGDWCIRGRVEAAFHSGLDAAQRIRALL